MSSEVYYIQEKKTEEKNYLSVKIKDKTKDFGSQETL